ncbi:hypothetical protein FIBSPDRAFT_877184 [Athelia psychrophila]|uniref:Uncharacterized protein n=1 Tax=Athelia psychrophila TaxID=1759441 RepID=A0A167W5Z4_9AGAM|nr:hypothetical protein FIBSPDRAFT_877184 [Fibularhizoctonia sp. CBS 109695]
MSLPFGACGYQSGISAWRFEGSRTLGKERTPAQITRPSGNHGSRIAVKGDLDVGVEDSGVTLSGFEDGRPV